MKKFYLPIIVFLLFVIPAPRVYSQNLNFFAQIIGVWESTDDGNGGQNKETWDVHWTLNKYFIEINIHGDNLRGAYDSKYLFTINEENQIVGWAFDADPAIYFMNFTGKNIDDNISVDGKGKNNGYKFTLRLQDGKLMRESVTTYKGDIIKGPVVVYIKK